MAFGFAGAAAGASDELQRQLAQRIALARIAQEQERQARLDADNAKYRDEQLHLQRDQATNVENERQYRRKLEGAQIAVENAPIDGTDLTPDVVGQIQGTPYASRLKTQDTLTARMGDPLNPQTVQGRRTVTLMPTDKQAQEQGQRTARRTVVDLIKRGAPRADLIAAMADAGENVGNAALTDPDKAARDREAQLALEHKYRLEEIVANGAQTRQTAEAKADATEAQKKALGSMQAYGDDILSVINNLVDEQGNLKKPIAGVVGNVEGAIPNMLRGEQGQTALADIDRLQGLLDINKLSEMKAQSRTGASGFGVLSEKELGVLESAASTLRNRRQSEAAYATELKRIRDAILAGRMGNGSTTAVVNPGNLGNVPPQGGFRVVGVR